MQKNVIWNILQSSNKKRDSSQAPLMRQVGYGLTIEPHIKQTSDEDLYSYTQYLLAAMDMCRRWDRVFVSQTRSGWMECG